MPMLLEMVVHQASHLVCSVVLEHVNVFMVSVSKISTIINDVCILLVCV